MHNLLSDLSHSDLHEFYHGKMQNLSGKESIRLFDTFRSSAPLPLFGIEQCLTPKARELWECMSTRHHSSLTPRFNNIRLKIKVKFNLEPFSWQVSATADIAQHIKDVFVIAGPNVGTNLTYQAILKLPEPSLYLFLRP